MSPIPPKIRKILEADPFMKQCCLYDDNCYGPIEWHHPFIHQGRQIQEVWSIVPVCEYHHRGEGQNLDALITVALRRATNKELLKYPRINWKIMDKKKKKKSKFYKCPKCGTETAFIICHHCGALTTKK